MAGNLVNFLDKNLNMPGADANVDDGYQFTSPVDAFPLGASPYGVLDMAGNVQQWVADWFGAGYYATSPTKDPTGPATPDPSNPVRLVRGGSWATPPVYARTTARVTNNPDRVGSNIGFRCATPGP